MCSNKQKIIALFTENVKGKKPDVSNANQRHDGKKGYWLEKQFGIAANAKNDADLFGYELKNETGSKTTFGDWSANYYIFTNKTYSNIFSGRRKADKQDIFCEIFGKPNPQKENRCSWSGTASPKILNYNDAGQILKVEDNKDIIVLYSFENDKREDKHTRVPSIFQREDLLIARWYGTTSPTTKRGDKCLKSKLEDKFNVNGWFTCKTDSNGYYNEICFGNPITYDIWIELIKTGTVYFDSGMYQGNSRPYSMWRADNSFWDSLIVERY
jgi:hypothetical protein